VLGSVLRGEPASPSAKQNKTRQDKTKQNKTRQDKTKQNKTKQNQNKTVFHSMLSIDEKYRN